MYEKGDLLNGRQIVLWLHLAESTGGMNMKTDGHLFSHSVYLRYCTALSLY